MKEYLVINMCDNKSRNELVFCVIYKAKNIFELCTNDLVVMSKEYSNSSSQIVQ